MSPVARVPLEVLQLAERGAKLFPCAPHSKKPLVDRWQTENNTSDPDLLLDIVRQVSDCNWGMVCGRASGIFALDYDCKAGRRGLEWYQHALEEHGVEWADTIRVITPSFGRHTYHQWIEGIGIDHEGRLGDGVDVQGQGSYILTPPSEVDGKRYRWEDCDGETDIAPVPSWLLPDIQRIFAPERAERAEPAEKKIPEGHRHATLLRHGKVLAKAGALWQGILRDFEILNQQFVPRLTHQELEYQARDIYERYRSRVHFTGKSPVETSRLILQPFSEIKVEPIEWMWPPYLPRGTMTLLTGEPGVGKSFIALWIAAKITKQGGNVIYFTIENSASKISLPRFLSLGGDLSRMYQVKGIQYGDPEDGKLRRVMLEDIPVIEREIARLNAAASIIDPLQSYLGQAVNSDRATETRPILDGLLEMTEKYNTTALVNRHGRKGSVGRILEKGLGTIDFTAAARSELYAGKTGEGQLAMMHIKANLGPLGPTMGYEIAGMSAEGVVSQGGYFSWTGELNLSPQDLMAPDVSREEENAGQEAEQFLTDYLGDGPKWQKEVIRKSRAEGIKEITLRRAKLKMKIGSEKRDGVWWWNLPSAYE